MSPVHGHRGVGAPSGAPSLSWLALASGGRSRRRLLRTGEGHSRAATRSHARGRRGRGAQADPVAMGGPHQRRHRARTNPRPLRCRGGCGRMRARTLAGGDCSHCATCTATGGGSLQDHTYASCLENYMSALVHGKSAGITPGASAFGVLATDLYKAEYIRVTDRHKTNF